MVVSGQYHDASALDIAIGSSDFFLVHLGKGRLEAVEERGAALIVRTSKDGERELVRARWGMPTPPSFVKGEADYGATAARPSQLATNSPAMNKLDGTLSQTNR